MLPDARVINPDDCVVETYRRELDGDYNRTGFDVWTELADLAEKFPSLLRRFDDLTDEELVQCFDRAMDSGGNPFLVLQLQKCGEEFQAASVMAAPGRCLVPPSPPGPPQH